MPVSFAHIPPNTLLPLFYAEVTSVQEPIFPNLKMCLIGHMNRGDGFDEGDAVEDYPYLLSGNLATQHFGKGSMLERMYLYARSNAPFAEIWGVAIREAEGAFRSTSTITVTRGGSETFFGTAGIFVDGKWVHFPIQKTSTPQHITTALKNAINSANCSVKVISTGTNSITVAARWAGGMGDDVRISYVGCRGRADLAQHEVWLARNCLKWTDMKNGSGEPGAADAFAVLQDRNFDVFVIPAGGSPSASQVMGACKTFMDHDSGRWAPNRQKYGHMFTARPNRTFQQMYEIFEPHNDPHMSMIAVKNTVLPPWAWGSALAGVATTHWAAPPELSRPLQTLQLRNCCCGSDDDESFSRLEKQTLLEQGATTITVRDDFTTVIDRVRTLRKRNDYEDPDPSWADAITMFQAMFFVRQMRYRIQGAYPRCALSTAPTGIYGFTSPVEIRALIVHEYKRMQSAGLVENTDLFARYLIVERNATDRNRVDVLMRPDMVNQLRVVATLVETHLELDATDPTLIT